MSEKTEEPTHKKLQDAKRKGQSPKSQDAVAAAILGVSLLVLTGAGPSMLERLTTVIQRALRQGMQAGTNEEVLALLADMLLDAIIAVMPMVIVSMLIAAIVLMAQIGVVFSFESISPKFDKLNPAEGLKKMFNARALIEFGKSVFKALALGTVVWVIVRDLVPLLVGAAYLTPEGEGQVAWSSLLHLLAAACLVFTVIAPLDYGLQRWLFMRDQKMSKDEVKREHKDSDGDPHVKGQQRQLREELANSAPQERVPGATVVVTNPTHYAVALRYDVREAPIPNVVAKGVDDEAATIRAIAAAHRVPMIANPPLARALHKLPLDEPISDELFEAVAVVLRWVADLDRLGGKR
jgi:type III secretion protein U